MDKAQTVIRDLARRVRNIADSDWMQARRQLWRDHNGLRKVRPPVMCRVGPTYLRKFWEVQGSNEVATEGVEQEIETFLRRKLMKIEIGDDEVIDPMIEIAAAFTGGTGLNDTWGVTVMPTIPKENGVERGAWKFNPPIKNENDLEKIKRPQVQIDEEATHRKLSRAEELLEGIIEVRVNRTGGFLIGASLSYHACFLRDLGQLMCDMVERPAWTHRLMTILRDATMNDITTVQEAGYLTADRVTGVSHLCLHCPNLPQSDFDGTHVRLIDTWGSAASQEFTGVSPAMMDEFLLQYQLPILERFGLNTYGCCESFNHKWHLLKKIPQLRRFSVSPWTNLEKAVEEMGPRYVMNWRVNPSDVLLKFNAEEMKQEVKAALRIAGRCPIEVVLQDIETVPGGLEQLQTWSAMAKQAAEESMETLV